MKRIFVFPCGSEIGLEIHRAMSYSAHFALVGGSSVDDHGRFVYEEYLGGLPFHDSPDFADRIATIVREHRIDAIYPTMDAVAETLQDLAGRLGILVIGSNARATALCASKQATYALLAGLIPTPARYPSLESIGDYPVFIKPDRGYGARNCLLANTREAAEAFLAGQRIGAMLLLEYLPGKEWTVDCFTDRHGRLRFHGVRQRSRISNGISVNTSPSTQFAAEFQNWAETINAALKPRGAWFFQAREDAAGQPKLLEVAARLGGSSGLFRCQGVNFALLSAFDAFGHDVDIERNAYAIELDRALDNRYRIGVDYTHVFVDLDDCLLIHGRLNHQLVGFLYKAVSAGKHLTLLTRHRRAPDETLRALRIRELFDRVIHITDGSPKSAHIDEERAIFIDDSFAERREVAHRHRVPTFSPDMVECLL